MKIFGLVIVYVATLATIGLCVIAHAGHPLLWFAVPIPIALGVEVAWGLCRGWRSL